MIKLRVQGLPDEVQVFGDALERAGIVLERSEQYRNRGRSQYVREYLDVAAPTEDDTALPCGADEGERQ